MDYSNRHPQITKKNKQTKRDRWKQMKDKVVHGVFTFAISEESTKNEDDVCGIC